MNGSMVLEEDRMDEPTNKPLHHRITWNANVDGTVRQHCERREAPDAAWEDVFDGLYRRDR